MVTHIIMTKVYKMIINHIKVPLKGDTLSLVSCLYGYCYGMFEICEHWNGKQSNMNPVIKPVFFVHGILKLYM